VPLHILQDAAAAAVLFVLVSSMFLSVSVVKSGKRLCVCAISGVPSVRKQQHSSEQTCYYYKVSDWIVKKKKIHRLHTYNCSDCVERLFESKNKLVEEVSVIITRSSTSLPSSFT
jgi:hypothetical protein